MTEAAMDQMKSLLLSLLASEIKQESPDAALFTSLTEEDWEQLYRAAAEQDLVHLIGHAVVTHHLLESGETFSRFENAVFRAMIRYESMNKDRRDIRAAFVAEGIPFILLKGSVLVNHYPEPWMRTSCDIDVLVHPEDMERAEKVCREKLGCSEATRSTHDIGFTTRRKTLAELHFDLIEDGTFSEAGKLLEDVWQYASPVEDTSEHVLSDEMFYYYHLAHMAKHVNVGGGCGIRPFLDLWVLNHRLPDNTGKRQELLEKGGLARFGETAVGVAEHWFEGKPEDELAARLEAFILSGNMSGNERQSIGVREAKGKGKRSFFAHRIFVPYSTLALGYPKLRGKPWLTPVYEVKRWTKLFRKSTRERVKEEVRTANDISSEEQAATRSLLEDLGIF